MKYFDLNEYLKKLEDIVNIDSKSSMPDGVSRVADYLEALYTELGLAVTRRRFSEQQAPVWRSTTARQKITSIFCS